MGVPGPSVGRVPLTQGVVFAGSANGESLWALPSSQSPEASSDSASNHGQPPVAVPPGTDDLMADIDWDAFDALFPPDQQIDLDPSGFLPGVGPY